MRGLTVVFQPFHTARAHGEFHMTTGNPRTIHVAPRLVKNIGRKVTSEPVTMAACQRTQNMQVRWSR